MAVKQLGELMGLMTMDRAMRVSVEGSPSFYYTNAQIAASGKAAFDMEFDVDQKGQLPAKYLPLDTISISNESTSTIRVDVGAHIVIAPGNSVKIKTNISFRSWEITNLDSSNAITAGKINISVWKEALTNDELIRRKSYGSPMVSLIPFNTIIRR